MKWKFGNISISQPVSISLLLLCPVSQLYQIIPKCHRMKLFLQYWMILSIFSQTWCCTQLWCLATSSRAPDSSSGSSTLNSALEQNETGNENKPLQLSVLCIAFFTRKSWLPFTSYVTYSKFLLCIQDMTAKRVALFN